MASVIDGLWRGVALLALAIAPYSAPAGVKAAASGVVLALRAAGCMSLAAAMGLALRWLLRRGARLGASVLAATVLAAVVSGFALPALRQPLPRGVWIVAPLAWLALAMVATTVVDRWWDRSLEQSSDSRARARARRQAFIACAVAGLGSVLSAVPRLTSSRTLLASDPGFETAALEEAAAFEADRRIGDADAVLFACAVSNPAACRCLGAALGPALDARQYDAVVDWTDRASPACMAEARAAGARAEALMAIGRPTDAEATATAALANGTRDARAAFAEALVAAARQDHVAAVAGARQAVGWGRGDPAVILLASELEHAGDPASAARTLADGLAAHADDVMLLFASAALADDQHQYHAAREGYLRVLALDPGFVDARYRLAVMTHALGADAEARHHLDEMSKIAPADPRIPPLRSILSASGPAPGQSR